MMQTAGKKSHVRLLTFEAGVYERTLKASEEQGRPQMQPPPLLRSGWVMFGAQGSNVALTPRTAALKKIFITIYSLKKTADYSHSCL